MLLLRDNDPFHFGTVPLAMFNVLRIETVKLALFKFIFTVPLYYSSLFSLYNSVGHMGPDPFHCDGEIIYNWNCCYRLLFVDTHLRQN